MEPRSDVVNSGPKRCDAVISNTLDTCRVERENGKYKLKAFEDSNLLDKDAENIPKPAKRTHVSI